MARKLPGINLFSSVALPGHSANASYAFQRPPDESTRVTDMQSLLDMLADQSCVASGNPPSSVKPVNRMDLLCSLASITVSLGPRTITRAGFVL